MPKYLVTKTSWLNLADPSDKSGSSPRYIKDGTVVDYSGPVGSNLQLLDEEGEKDAAIAAKAERMAALNPTKAEWDAARKRIEELEAQIASQPNGDKAADAPAEIPADWENLTPSKRLALARRLGAPMTTKAEGARDYIAAEVARRAAAAKPNPVLKPSGLYQAAPTKPFEPNPSASPTE